MGTFYSKYPDPDPDMYGLSCDYYNIQLKIVKLPSELLNVEILKFKTDYDDRPEYLCFNIYKINFNQDGTFTILP